MPEPVRFFNSLPPAPALGLGGAGGYPAAIKTVAEWFPQRERTPAAGTLNAGANVGALVTPLLVPLLVLAFGWRAAFVVTGAMGPKQTF